jgi:hypothetical protein
MKTLTDLLNLITKEIELTQNKMVNFEFVIDTRFNWLTFEKVSPEVDEDGEFTGNDKREIILSSVKFDNPERIQQAYWTIYNEGRYQYNK